MGRWAGCGLRGSHSHLVWGLRRVETTPSAAFGVEVEQGAARKADDKLMGGDEDEQEGGKDEREEF